MSQEAMKNLTKVIFTCFALLLSSTVSAATINGSLGVGGVYAATGGSDLSDVSLLTLTNVGATFAVDDIALFVVGDPAVVANGILNLDSFVAGANFWTVEGFMLDITSLEIDSAPRTESALLLSGAGILSGNGYEATIANWTFSTQSLTSYSMTATASGIAAIPVPAAAWLFGSGMIGLVGVARRRA